MLKDARHSIATIGARLRQYALFLAEIFQGTQRSHSLLVRGLLALTNLPADPRKLMSVA